MRLEVPHATREHLPIVNAAWLTARDKRPGAPRTSGKCIAFVRVVVEFAFGGNRYDLFASYFEANTTRLPRRDAKSLVVAHPDPCANYNVGNAKHDANANEDKRCWASRHRPTAVCSRFSPIWPPFGAAIHFDLCNPILHPIAN